MEQPALLPSDAKARAFWAGVTVLLLLVSLYTGLAMHSWAATPLGLRPQGEATVWVNDAEKLSQGTLAREPFFRAPAYLAVLATLREVGVPASGLANAARILNGISHVVCTALVIGLGLRFWRRRGALLAGALWGFYPPAVYFALQPGPASLALLAWLGGAAAALGTFWQSPLWQGGRLSRRHVWAYPFVAGVSFVLAAALYAPLWPLALAWPWLAMFLGRDKRVHRFLAAAFGCSMIAAGIVGFQIIWGGSPQPLAGEELYRLARALEITQPWNAPLPTVEFSANAASSDNLELEAGQSYQFQTKQGPPGHAVLNGYWWRAAIRNAWYSPARSVLRAARKTSQFFAEPNYSPVSNYARAQAEVPLLKYNPLNWGVLLTLGLIGLVRNWRTPGVMLAVLLATLVIAGGVIWYPVMEARAPVAVLLALFAGALASGPGPRTRRNKILPWLVVPLAMALAWWPRRNSPAETLAAIDSRERAFALAELGRFDEAQQELAGPKHEAPLNLFEREMLAGWQFQQLLDHLPARPSTAQLEAQLLENGDLAGKSPSSQFRCGACLWLLGRWDGALYFWDDLANDQSRWGAAARTAIVESGNENPAQAQRRIAWEIGGGQQADPSLAPFFAIMRADAAKAARPSK